MNTLLLIYNEKELSEKVYEIGFSEGFEYFEALLVAKHLLWTLDYGAARTKTALIEFCTVHDKYFNYVRNRKLIGKIIKRAEREGLLDTSSVNITQSELEKIRSIKNFKSQKIVLAMLFISKRKTNGGYINLKDWPSIKKLSCVSGITRKDILAVGSLLYNLEWLAPVNASYRLTFGDDVSDTVISVDTNQDAVNLISTYTAYCGGKLFYCKRCQQEMVQRKDRQRFCDDCLRLNVLEKYKRANEKRKMPKDG